MQLLGLEVAGLKTLSEYPDALKVDPRVCDFTETEGGAGIRRKNYTWSKMLARVFKIDVLRCEDCGGHLRPVCAVTEPDSIRRYLRHMNIDYDPPPRRPPRFTQGVFDFDGEDQSLPK